MFPKNEKHRFSVSDMFSKLLQPCFFQWSKAVCVNFHRPTYQEFTPTSNIALLILCSRQAIVPLCRPGGVRAARFNKKCNVASRCEFLVCWPVEVDTTKPLTTERNMTAGSLEIYRKRRICVFSFFGEV